MRLTGSGLAFGPVKSGDFPVSAKIYSVLFEKVADTVYFKSAG